MAFHIEKKHPRAGTLYYAGNNQWNQKKDHRMIYETEDCAQCECNSVRGTVVEEA